MDNEEKFYECDKETKALVKKIKGPIFIFGAGGFIGVNLLKTLSLYRKDVFGLSKDAKNNWRFAHAHIPSSQLLTCDITSRKDIDEIFSKHRPQTIFNFAAYGAYSKQSDSEKIYQTNFIANNYIVETAKKYKFSAYIYSGTSSEYGLNCKGPKEDDELIPNSHYAVSKVATYYALKYFGKVEGLPVIHLRLYSVYGPWEESDRLIPSLIQKARHGDFPKFVNPRISRDFIHVSDVSRAYIFAAAKMKPKLFGEAFNIGTNVKTTIRELAFITKKIANINKSPEFGRMENRKWDLSDWYGDSNKAARLLGWKAQVKLVDGLKATLDWQEKVDYDTLIQKIK